MRFNLNKTKSDEIVRHRLYKSKKQWVVAGTILLSFLGASALTTADTNKVYADTTTPTTSVDPSSSSSPITAPSSSDSNDSESTPSTESLPSSSDSAPTSVATPSSSSAPIAADTTPTSATPPASSLVDSEFAPGNSIDYTDPETGKTVTLTSEPVQYIKSVTENIIYNYPDGSSTTTTNVYYFYRSVGTKIVKNDAGEFEIINTFSSWYWFDTDTRISSDNIILAAISNPSPLNTTIKDVTTTIDGNPVENGAGLITIAGTATLDQDIIVNRVVTLESNLCKAFVNFIDATDNQVLGTSTLANSSGPDIAYDVSDVITKYLAAGYVLSTSELPNVSAIGTITGSQTGLTYNVYFTHATETFDAIDAAVEGFSNLAALKTTVSLNDIVVKPDGSKTITPNIIFELTRTVTVDYTKRNADGSLTDEAYTYGPWMSTTDSVSVAVPYYTQLTGYSNHIHTEYTISGLVIKINGDQSLTISFDPNAVSISADIVRTVTYIPNSQAAQINYIDDDTNTVLYSDVINGDTNSLANYSTADMIKMLLAENYELVSDDLADGSLTFDADSYINQVFNVHFKHKTATLTASNPGSGSIDEMLKTVSETVNFEYSDGSQAASPIVKTMQFMRYGTQDLVTGVVSYENNWILVSGSNTFDEIIVPIIVGYTANISKISRMKNVTSDTSSFSYLVRYTANVTIPDSPATSDVPNSSSTPATSTETSELTASSAVAVSSTATVSSSEDIQTNNGATNDSDETKNTSDSKNSDNSSDSKSSESTSNLSSSHFDFAKLITSPGGSNDDGGGGGGTGGGSGADEISLGAYFASLAGTIIFAQE